MQKGVQIIVVVVVVVVVVVDCTVKGLHKGLQFFLL